MKQSDWLIFFPGSLEASGKILRDFAGLLADILFCRFFFQMQTWVLNLCVRNHYLADSVVSLLLTLIHWTGTGTLDCVTQSLKWGHMDRKRFPD